MVQRIYILILILVPTSLLISENLNAATLDIEPGKWQFRIIISPEKNSDYNIETKTRCFKDSNFNPFKEFKKNQNNLGCHIRNIQTVAGKSVRWNWSCKKNADNPATSGRGMYSSTGSKIEGFLVTFSNKDGKRKVTDIDIQGKYLGKCSEKEDAVFSRLGK